MVTYAPTACRHKVSGSVSLPSRGSFHPSLTVLFAIGHWVVFRLGGWAPRLQTGFHVSGPTLVSVKISQPFEYGAFTLFGGTFQSSSSRYPHTLSQIHNPKPEGLVWPLSRSLAATWEIDVSFSSWGYLDVSVHPVSSSHAMCSHAGTRTLLQVSSLIRKSAGQCLFAAHRSLSQLVTSFFGSQCQGIRLVPLFT